MKGKADARMTAIFLWHRVIDTYQGLVAFEYDPAIGGIWELERFAITTAYMLMVRLVSKISAPKRPSKNQPGRARISRIRPPCTTPCCARALNTAPPRIKQGVVSPDRFVSFNRPKNRIRANSMRIKCCLSSSLLSHWVLCSKEKTTYKNDTKSRKTWHRHVIAW